MGAAILAASGLASLKFGQGFLHKRIVRKQRHVLLQGLMGLGELFQGQIAEHQRFLNVA